MKKIGLIIGIILIAVLAFFYFGSYSSGTQAGVVMKISKKGVVFKTWEGRLDMGTVGRSKSSELGTKIFEFSIDGSNEALVKKLEEVQLSGQRINLGFEQKYVIFPWQGETKYFATSVESSGVIEEENETGLPQLDE
ncbi:MAG: 6-phosphogluconate dehydrogenase [Flavobacteriales bacterium]|nr:6-phosphogluconate dehydrogenase [Flavobacteriales bacterium]